MALTHYCPGEDVEFVCLDVHIAMEDVYQEINFDELLVEE